MLFVTSNYQFLIGFILTLLFLTGLQIRLRRLKKIDWHVDSVLLIQLFALVLFCCPIFHSYFIGPYLFSLFLSLVFIALDKQKENRNKLIIGLIVFFPFLSLLSKMEHWWWSYYTNITIAISAILFCICILSYPEKIKKELPYLLLFAFDIFYVPIEFLCRLY